MVNKFFAESNLLIIDEVDSTNDFAKKYAEQTLNVMEGTSIVAKHQTKGKGQRGNSWESEATKNLTFSVILYPNISIENQFQLSKIVALALVELLISLDIKNAEIKWPNDIYVNGKKIAGILIENSIKDKKIEQAIVGVGLNVNQVSFSLPNATSLNLITSINYELNALVSSFLDFLEKRYFLLKTNQHHTINDAYLKHLMGYKKKLWFISSLTNDVFNAEIVGISPLGKLQLKRTTHLKEEYDIKEVMFKTGD